MLKGARGERLVDLWVGNCVVGCKTMSPAQPVMKPGRTVLWSHGSDPLWLLPVWLCQCQGPQSGREEPLCWGAGLGSCTCAAWGKFLLLSSAFLPPFLSSEPPIKKDPDNTIKMSCVDCKLIVRWKLIRARVNTTAPSPPAWRFIYTRAQALAPALCHAAVKHWLCYSAGWLNNYSPESPNHTKEQAYHC